MLPEVNDVLNVTRISSKFENDKHWDLTPDSLRSCRGVLKIEAMKSIPKTSSVLCQGICAVAGSVN